MIALSLQTTPQINDHVHTQTSTSHAYDTNVRVASDLRQVFLLGGSVTVRVQTHVLI